MKTKHKILFTTAITALGLVACKNETKTAESIPGIALENMDVNTKPSDDFFRYVNGAWIDRTEIPDDQTSWGGFNQLRKKTDADVLAILNEAIQEEISLKLKIVMETK
ncbi:hypothetical protein [Tenacibaculum sp. SG-28]|uniref:hypothetical protein n=1 Tax=Tenacibaculum sp. SG-28 TaxID=754426 RepID=UPI0026C9F06C